MSCPDCPGWSSWRRARAPVPAPTGAARTPACWPRSDRGWPRSGVPAVVAMQGNITMTTAAAFTTAFFRSLERGRARRPRDRGRPRAAVRDRPDWWVPALFMRLKSGRLWYVPGQSPAASGSDMWPSLITDDQGGMCTPIIGPGDQRRAARAPGRRSRSDWARSYRFPMAPAQPGEPARRSPSTCRSTRAAASSRLELDEPAARHAARSATATTWPPDRSATTRPSRTCSPRPGPRCTGARSRRAVLGPGRAAAADLPHDPAVPAARARALTDAGRSRRSSSAAGTRTTDWPESVFDREPGYRPTARAPARLPPARDLRRARVRSS